ncbi:MAG TPA: hypothetical protein VFH73_22815 [Polyangia bacterium]|nr:hypothetical protein [Polyangia bacterium]
MTYRTHRALGSAAAALTLLVAFGRASADTGAVPPARPPVADSGAQKTAASPAGEAVPDGEKRLRNMTTRVSRIKLIREHAATARDASLVGCVQYQEAKAKVVLQLAQDAQQALTQASGDNDAAERSYQASRIMMLDDMLQGVQKAAHLCVDQELSTVQAYKVEVDVNEAIPSLEPNVAAPMLTVERPPER